MMSSGSTVLRFCFDIFSIEPIVISSPVSIRLARRHCRDLDPDLGRRHVTAVDLLIGLVHHHALREHAGKWLVHADVAGGLHGADEEAAVEQMQDRVLDAADILVDRHQPVATAGVVGAFSFHGSVKRAKYHDESTKVSMVSVSRCALPPHCGQVTCFQVG